MLILGLDISMTNTGWVLVKCDSDDKLWVKDCGVIQTEKLSSGEKVSSTVDGVRRAHKVESELRDILSKQTEPVVAICVEAMSWPRNAGSAIKMALVWGALSPLLVSKALIDVGPQELKKVLTGAKSATKEEVEDAVKQRLSHSHKAVSVVESKVGKTRREHVWDALGAILSAQKRASWALLKAGYWKK